MNKGPKNSLKDLENQEKSIVIKLYKVIFKATISIYKKCILMSPNISVPRLSKIIGHNGFALFTILGLIRVLEVPAF